MANEKRLIDANALTDVVEHIDWYHVSVKGNLIQGANSEFDTPLYKADDIYEALEKAPTVDAVEVPKEDYYVLRNTETGLYFRGKGVNRWGKHFNQATIYRVKGTAEHSIKEVAWHGEKAELVRIKIIELGERKDNGTSKIG